MDKSGYPLKKVEFPSQVGKLVGLFKDVCPTLKRNSSVRA